MECYHYPIVCTQYRWHVLITHVYMLSKSTEFFLAIICIEGISYDFVFSSLELFMHPSDFECLMAASLPVVRPPFMKEKFQFFSLQIAFSIHMPLIHHISISAQALTPKLNTCTLPASINRLMILTMPTH